MPLKKGDTCIVNSCVSKLVGQEFVVEDTTQKVLGWDDPMMATFLTPVLINLVAKSHGEPDTPYSGTFYYGKIKGLGYALHESWLTLKEDTKDETGDETKEEPPAEADA